MKRAAMGMAAVALIAGGAWAMGEKPADVTEASDEAWQPKPFVQLQNPEWSRDAVLYQINTRQFTPEGTFKAAQEQLPRLKELGVDVLWLMPIHPTARARSARPIR